MGQKKGYVQPDYVKKKISETMKKVAIAVVQYDLIWNKIAEYESMKEAERQTGAAVGNISRCCKKNAVKEKHVIHTAGGFIWKYAKK